MADVNVKEMTFEVVIGSATKSIETAAAAAQKGLVEAFKTAANQDALSAISGRLGMALPYATVTFAKVASKHGYDAVKVVIAIRSDDPEKVAREIFTAAVGATIGGASGSLVTLAATFTGPFAIPIGIGAGLGIGYGASQYAGTLWDNDLRHTAAGQWSSHQVGKFFQMDIKRTQGTAPTALAQINDVPPANQPVNSMLVFDPTDQKNKIIFNTSKVIDSDVTPSAHTYTVQKGDTLWSIAKRNGWDEQALKAANPQISDYNFIRTNQIINKPTGALAPIDNHRAPQITVNPSPQAQTKIEREGEAASAVSAGYAYKTPTASVVFKQGELDSAEFTASQRAGLATANVRPGAVQVDPNPRPAQWLAQHVGATDQLNAAIFGGFAMGSTQQTFVDPIVLDLGTQGISLSDYRNDGVLFDADHSGYQTRTGWVSKEDGLLVQDVNGDGIINNISEVFSEYSGGKIGMNSAAGEKKHANGFAALRALDSNRDHLFTAQDSAWQQVKVWVDANHDGNLFSLGV